MTIEVTGELGNLCAARQAELEVVRNKKNDREAEIKRLRVINAELLDAANKVWEERVAIFCVETDSHLAHSPLGQALLGLRDAIRKAEGS